MRLKLEEKEKQYRAIYEALWKNPRIFRKDIVKLLHTNYVSVNNRLEEAYTLGWLSKPQIRRRSSRNFGEHVYFLKCPDPPEVFSQFVGKENVVYHALCSGEMNMWVVARGNLNLPCECDALLEGLRSDYHVSFAPHQPWETAIQKMRKMIEGFNPKEYEPQRIIDILWDETMEWDSEYEALFREFNYDLSRQITPILRKHRISWEKVERWMRNLSTYCTVFTLYYPGGISSYDPYLFMFETEYEDFLVNLFSELPTSALFFKVSDRLFAYLHVKREYVRVVNSQIDIRRLQIPSMIKNLTKKGVIKKESHKIVECYWNNDPWKS